MNKFGLIGNNISYSKSPILHKIISDVYGLDLIYNLLDIKENEIDNYLNMDFTGFNITKPYKEVLLNKINNKTTIVKKTNAANVIYIKNNELYLDNTDYNGFKYLLKYYNINVKDKKIAILGTGGAAKVCYYALSEYTNNIIFISRNKKNSNTITYDNFINKDIDIIVNATPIGTSPNISDSPLTKEQVNNSLVIDLIYNPLETKLMSYAKESYNGIIMLIVQALYAQRRWNDKYISITKNKINIIKEKLICSLMDQNLE